MPYQRLLPQSNRVREKTLMFCNSSNRCLQSITKCSFSPSLAFYSSCNREKTSSCKSNYFQKVTIIQIISIHTPPSWRRNIRADSVAKIWTGFPKEKQQPLTRFSAPEMPVWLHCSISLPITDFWNDRLDDAKIVGDKEELLAYLEIYPSEIHNRISFLKKKIQIIF